MVFWRRIYCSLAIKLEAGQNRKVLTVPRLIFSKITEPPVGIFIKCGLVSACAVVCGCTSVEKTSLSDEQFLKKYPTVRKDGKAYRVIPHEDIIMREQIPPPPAPTQAGSSSLVDIAARRAWLYRDGQVVRASAVCTGKPGFETPTGEFKVISRHRDWVSTIYKVPMPYFVRLNADSGKVGLHAGAIALQPSSHGCIRLPKKDAEVFFRELPVGSKVVVVNSSPTNPQPEPSPPTQEVL
jgi:hypothetical protein